MGQSALHGEGVMKSIFDASNVVEADAFIGGMEFMGSVSV